MTTRRRRYRSSKSPSRASKAVSRFSAHAPAATEPSEIDHGSHEIQERLNQIARHYEELEQILGRLESDGSILVAQLSQGTGRCDGAIGETQQRSHDPEAMTNDKIAAHPSPRRKPR